MVETCERCGEEATELTEVHLPAVSAFRDDIRQYELQKRQICHNCARNLRVWWLEKALERATGNLR